MRQSEKSQPTPPYYVLIKPTGADCNLDCKYCFYLSKEALYPGSDFRMSESVLEQYIRQLLESHPGPQVPLAWQGGEPTLMGLDYFRKAVEFAERYKRPGQALQYSIQTNGVLINANWAKFFHDHQFLVGISLDGPADLHDSFRVDKSGAATHAKVVRGLKYLNEHQVEYNILCTVNAVNSFHPLKVYRYFRDELQARYIQFIPIVERMNGTAASAHSVKAEQWGRFLVEIFDEWVRRDVGLVFITMFEDALANWLGVPAGTCVFNPTCGSALAIEHNGDLYSCDHFVTAEHLLGNIGKVSLVEMITSTPQQKFGLNKKEMLPKYCRECSVSFACYGGCPKDRFVTTPDGETGLNYLCIGYKQFFQHIELPMNFMANELRQKRSPIRVMEHMNAMSAKASS